MEKISINLPYIREEILIGSNILEEIQKRIDLYEYDKFFVAIDEQAYSYHKIYFESLFKYLEIPSSHILFLKPIPKHKDLKHAQILIKNLVKIRASRKTCILSIGGGYVGDLVGFVASIYMRGIDFIQIPTTLMSQCDVIMGKVAVNFGKIKNLIGAFYSPKNVFCEINFLQSFSKLEQLYGLVEIWKHAILFNDKKIVSEINSYLKDDVVINYQQFVNFSLVVKKHFVEKDPWDTNGYHKALSLGHTLANALESDPTFRHGLAVFYGIIFESMLAKNISKLNNDKYDEILYTASLFEKHFNCLKKIQNIFKNKHILQDLKFDKINSNGTYSFVIPTDDSYYLYKNVPINMINKTFDNFLTYSLHYVKNTVHSSEKIIRRFPMKKRVRAVIIENGSLLLVHRVKSDKEYWVFPGGGLEESDASDQDGLRRECEEELGVTISVGNLFAEKVFDSPTGKQTEVFFLCHITGGQIGTGKGPESTRDPKQFGIYELQWVPVEVLKEKNVQPSEIRDKVLSLSK